MAAGEAVAAGLEPAAVAGLSGHSTRVEPGRYTARIDVAHGAMARLARLQEGGADGQGGGRAAAGDPHPGPQRARRGRPVTAVPGSSLRERPLGQGPGTNGMVWHAKAPEGPVERFTLKLQTGSIDGFDGTGHRHFSLVQPVTPSRDRPDLRRVNPPTPSDTHGRALVDFRLTSPALTR
jgi:hypothetical protein